MFIFFIIGFDRDGDSDGSFVRLWGFVFLFFNFEFFDGVVIGIFEFCNLGCLMLSFVLSFCDEIVLFFFVFGDGSFWVFMVFFFMFFKCCSICV